MQNCLNNKEEDQPKEIPIIDLQKYVDGELDTKDISSLIRETCKKTGFFYIKNHGVPEELQKSILENASKFFELPLEQKQKIHMKKGGRAWRGYFSVG